ncbi:hypothetical protein [Halobacillus litoralis]|nr:hypothetical protein [Halobacillus litoralis]
MKEPKWYYLFKVDEGHNVYVYEPLTAKEVQTMQKLGWKVRKI